MKVYRLKTDVIASGNGISFSHKAGWIYCEQEDGTGKKYYYNPSYPIPEEWIDDRFEFIFDDIEHDKDYYIQPIYTEYQLQEILKSKQ